MSDHVSVLDKQITLKLNKHWVAVGYLTVREAVVFLASENQGEKPGFAMDYEMVTDENGVQVLSYANPVAWDDWVRLPIRDSDLAINTVRGQIRVPLIVVCAHYDRIPMHTPRASAGTIFARDKGVCQYTGEYVGRAGGNLDHVTPRSRGGREAFSNLVWCKKGVNSLKADRTPEEAGLRLIRQPNAPHAMPVVITADDAKHPAHRPFLL